MVDLNIFLLRVTTRCYFDARMSVLINPYKHTIKAYYKSVWCLYKPRHSLLCFWITEKATNIFLSLIISRFLLLSITNLTTYIREFAIEKRRMSVAPTASNWSIIFEESLDFTNAETATAKMKRLTNTQIKNTDQTHHHHRQELKSLELSYQEWSISG